LEFQAVEMTHRRNSAKPQNSRIFATGQQPEFLGKKYGLGVCYHPKAQKFDFEVKLLLSCAR
jgi:hypothetical protein